MDTEAIRTGPLTDHPDPAPILEAATVFEGRVWDINRETVTFHGGTMTRDYVAHSGAVAVLAIDDENRVLFINQYRQPIRTRDWEVPAGLLDVEGEEPLAAAMRELAEETDLVAAEWSEPIAIFTSPGGSDEVVHLFEARGLSAAPKPHDRTDEEAEIVIRWVSMEDALEAIFDGRLHNGILITAVLAAHARR